MKNLEININGHMLNDMKKTFKNPKKYGKPGTHVMYLKSTKELYKIFSPKRLELLQYLLSYKDKYYSVSKIAKLTKRKQEAISRDARILQSHGIIKKIKKDKEVILETELESFKVELSGA